MHPYGVFERTDGGNDRFAVRGHGDSLLRRWAKGDLLGLSVWKRLPPEMSTGAKLPSWTPYGAYVVSRGDIGPFAIGRPRACDATVSWRTDDLDVACSLKWNDAARQELALIAHLDNEDRTAIGRKVGMVRHAAFAGRYVYVAAVSPAFIRGYHAQIQPFSHLREEQLPALLDPGDGGRVGEQKAGLAAQNRHLQRVPGFDGAVRDAGAIRREGRSELARRVMGKLDRLATREAA